MRELLVVAAAVVAGCAEPVVELSFRAPATDQDTSCVSAVEVRAIGAKYQQDPTDYTRSCVPLDHPAASFADLRAQVHGLFALDVPASGLAGVAVRGWVGPDACRRTDETDPDYHNDQNSDLAFYGAGDYAGQDALTVEAVPNLECTTSSVRVRVVDMLGLVAAGSTSGCTAAMTFPDNAGWSGIGTITPRLFGKGVDFFGNASIDVNTNNAVQLDALIDMARIDRSCLAVAGFNGKSASTACVLGGAHVCAGSGELEMAAVDIGVWQQIDRTIAGQFPSVLFGSVWSAGAPGTPVAGATVSADRAHARVVYIDAPDASGVVHERTDQTQTGPSGLFLLYADAVVTATIRGAGKTRTVLLGSPDYTMGGALIALP